LRSDKYKPPAGRLLEFYESDSSVEANEDTDAEARDDVEAGPGAGGGAKCRTRSTVGKQSASAVAAISAVKAAKKEEEEEEEGRFPSGGCYTVDSDAPLMGGRDRRQRGGGGHRRVAGHRGSIGKEVREPCCQEAVGAGTKDIRGSPPTWFRSAADCCHSADKDACSNEASAI
jgi:hypothetical protein